MVLEFGASLRSQIGTGQCLCEIWAMEIELRTTYWTSIRLLVKKRPR